MFLKRLCLAVGFFMYAPALFSQVGINTTAPNAQLEIRATNQAAPSNTDGILIPKIDAFPATDPTAAQQGMMVYLTTASGGKSPGFYFWDNTTSSWVGFASKKGWDVTGNSSTTPATNFIGTTDSQPLAFRTNNAEQLRITDVGNVGIGTANPQNKLHVMAAATGMTPNPGSVATIENTTPAYFSLLSNSETGVLFGANGNSTNGAIVYNSPALPDGMLFRNSGNVNRMVIGPTGNIGFGNFIPSYPLHFPSTLGDKVALWGGSGIHYGLGIQNNLLQIHADSSLSDVAFGYGQSSAFTETMRIKGNGRLGLGTSAPNARIEVTASNAATPANTDGMLIPRINAFPASNPTAAQDAMMVYLTTASGGKSPGFYYWDNASATWKTIGGSGSPTNWGLAGNSGTNATNNFIGTTDNIDFLFKRNNVRSGLISTSNTSFGNSALNPAATGLRNTAMGNYAMRLNVDGHNNTAVGNNALEFNTSGFRNTAIGSNALVANQTGGYSTAVGTSVLMSNTTGGSNTAVGDYSMPSNTEGLFNVALGNSTLKDNLDGDGNTAIGHRAMFGNVNGNYSTAVGQNALYNNLSSGIVGIGFEALAANTSGLYNTAIGTNSLRNNTTGGYNTAGGYNAAYANTGSYITALGVNALVGANTASGITAIGSAALYSNTSGANNTAVGYTSLNFNTTGNWNTAMGYSALYQSNGNNNSAFGNSALLTNQNGSDNTAMGSAALLLNTNGSRNTATGVSALSANTLGGQNTANGFQALVANQSGDNNTAVGVYTLTANVSGSDNTAMGREALKSNTGSGGTAVGVQALLSNVDGQYNTGIGVNALRANISGSYNTATGYNALLTNTGTFNTAMGVNSLLTNSSGTSNTAVGYRSLYHNTTAGWNTAVGDAAMYENVDGEANSALGHHAMQGNVSGSYNTVMGVNAVYHNPSGMNNTAIGHSAMANVNPGNNNTALGASAMVTQTAGSNNIAIGVNSALPVLTGSNQMSIANVVYGSEMAATTTGKIAIGKTTPDAKLDIAASNAAAPANTDGLLIPRVSTFPVSNPTTAQNGMMIFLTTAIGVYPAGFYYWDNTAVSWIGVGTKNNWSTFGNAGTSPATHYIGTSDSNDVSMRVNGTEAMRLEVGGNVGIGTNNPSTKLEVNGFTKLGSNAPAIKNLKLTGMTNSTQGIQTTIAHGLNSAKILSVSVFVEYTPGSGIPPQYQANTGYEYDYYFNATNVIVWPKSGNSGNILSKPIRVLVTYEE